MGTYVARNVSGNAFTLSVGNDNTAFLYGKKNETLLKGKLNFNKNEKCYLFTTDSGTYQIAVRDNVIFLPVTENGRIVSKLFTKKGDIAVTY